MIHLEEVRREARSYRFSFISVFCPLSHVSVHSIVISLSHILSAPCWYQLTTPPSLSFLRLAILHVLLVSFELSESIILIYLL